MVSCGLWLGPQPHKATGSASSAAGSGALSVSRETSLPLHGKRWNAAAAMQTKLEEELDVFKILELQGSPAT